MRAHHLRGQAHRPKIIKRVKSFGDGKAEHPILGQQFPHLFEPEDRIGHMLDHVMRHNATKSRGDLFGNLALFATWLTSTAAGRFRRGLFQCILDQLSTGEKIEVFDLVAEFPAKSGIVESADFQSSTDQFAPMTNQKIATTLRDLRQHSATIETHAPNLMLLAETRWVREQMAAGLSQTRNSDRNMALAETESICGLSPRSRLLAIGCGQGRLLTGIFASFGRIRQYVGLEVHKPSIDWASQNLAAGQPNIAFHHLAVLNERYNPQAERTSTDFAFPVAADNLTWSAFSQFFPT